MTLLVVGAGGFIGAVARYWITDWVRLAWGDAMPWGTLSVNVVGSFALGALLVWAQSHAPSDTLRQFVGIGVLGSFTTFSTFSYETVLLARAGETLRAGGYAVGSLALGVVAVITGIAFATWIVQLRG